MTGKVGRPRKPDEQRASVKFSVSLTPSQKLKFLRHGGSKFLRAVLQALPDRPKVPRLEGDWK